MAPRGVVVTGSRTGIGLGIARKFLENGDKVVMISRSVDKVKEEEDIDRYVNAGQAVLLTADLREVSESASVISQCVEALGGRLDVLVNNAGWGSAGVQFEDVSYEHYREHFTLNLDALFFLIQAAIPQLIKTKGSIVNISSIGGIRPANFMFTYCITKAGVDMLTKALAVEYAPKGVRINSINPGVVESDIFEASGAADSQEKKQEFLDGIAKDNPLRRVGQPADVGNLALFLADNERSSWITGQQVALDGGTLLSQ